MTNILYIITQVGNVIPTLIIFAIISLLLYRKHKEKVMFTLIFAGLLASNITLLLKNFFKIDRPLDMLYIEEGYRFPSGHATIAAVFASFIIFYFSRYAHDKTVKYLAYAFAIFWILIISYTRIYFKVHYLLDVLVGTVIGVTSFYVIAKIFKHLSYKK